MQRRRLRLPAGVAWWHEDEVSDGRPVAHFFHANGFAFGAYRALHEGLASQLRVVGLEMRPLWPDAGRPDPGLRWHDHGDDLIAALQAAKTGPVIGIGHSMGATASVFAAARRPDLFRALVLVEPAFVTRAITMLDPVIPYRVRRFVEPARSTLTRRERWPDRDAMLATYRGRGLFRRVPEPVLQDFADASLRHENGGVALRYSRAWEAHYYMVPASIWPELWRVKVPVLALHGDHSVYLPARAWKNWRRRHPRHTLVERPGRGHLLPLEDPEGTAAVLLDWLDATDGRPRSHPR